MKTTLSDATTLMIGKYHPIAFAVYAMLMTGIENSEHGEFHFTVNSLVLRMTYPTGRRPTRVNREAVRRAIDKFWEDGVFEFSTGPKGTVARVAGGGDEWKTTLNVV